MANKNLSFTSQNSENEVSFVEDDMEYESSSESREVEISDAVVSKLALSIEKVLSQKLDDRFRKMEGMVKSSITKQDRKIDHITQKYQKLESEIAKLKQDNVFLKKLVKEKNVIVHGIKDDNIPDEDLAAQMEKFITDVTKVKITPDVVYRIGQFQPDQCRPICIKLDSLSDKNKIIHHRADFKIAKPECSITGDMPNEIRSAHKLLYQKRDELKLNGTDGTICFKTLSIRTLSGEMFRIVDGRLHTSSNLKRPASEANNSNDDNEPSTSKKAKVTKKPFLGAYSVRNTTLAQRQAAKNREKKGTQKDSGT